MQWLIDLLKKLFVEWWQKKDVPQSGDEQSQNGDTLPDAHLSRCAYSLLELRAFPVHPVTMKLRGHNLVTTGEALKISEAFGMGCEITWWFRWDGKLYARTIEGYRASDCADGSASKDIPDGWLGFRGCGYFHEGEEGLTWWNVQDDPRGENVGYSASKVVSRRNNAEPWRSGIVRPE